LAWSRSPSRCRQSRAVHRSSACFFARAEATPACVPISGRLSVKVPGTTRCGHGFYTGTCSASAAAFRRPSIVGLLRYGRTAVRPSRGLYSCYLLEFIDQSIPGAHFKSLLMTFTSIISPRSPHSPFFLYNFPPVNRSL